MILIRRPWTRQPQWNAPRNLLGLFHDATFMWSGATPHELVGGRFPSTRNASMSPGAHGISAGCSTGQQNLDWSGYDQLITSDGAGTGDFALMVVANPASGGGSVQHMLAIKNDAGGSPFSQTALLSNSNSDAGYSAGRASFFTYSGLVSGVDAAGVVDGQMHVYVGVRRGSIHEIWVDGLLLSSNSLGIRTIAQSNRHLGIGSRGNGTTEALAGDVLFAAGWNRAPSYGEIASIRRPWDIWGLAFAPSRIVIPHAASGIVPPTLLAASAVNIGTTYATPRVTFTRP